MDAACSWMAPLKIPSYGKNVAINMTWPNGEVVLRKNGNKQILSLKIVWRKRRAIHNSLD
jgi:hypothetical protein